MLPFSMLDTIGLEQKLFDKKEISAKEVSLPANTTIFQSGDPCGAFLIVISGKVRVDITTKSGREVLLYRMGECDTCVITTSVLLNHENYYARAVTESDVTAIAISADDFHKALKISHCFSHYVLEKYAQRMSALIALLDKITSKDILYELSYLLLHHANDDGVVELTQKDIAREIGTAREVVSRKLSALEEQGIVKVQRGKVQVLDHRYLQANVFI